MSNIATIQPTIFQDHNAEEKSFGVRVFDNYGQSYDNTWESIPDDDMAILKLVADNQNETVGGIFEFIVENENGIMIGKEYYDWEDIREFLE